MRKKKGYIKNIKKFALQVCSYISPLIVMFFTNSRKTMYQKNKSSQLTHNHKKIKIYKTHLMVIKIF